MGLRYRRYIRIMPGVRLNVSKSGVSWTLGPRGANINIGKRGTYANVGVPGTGVFDRERLSRPRGHAHESREKPEPAEAPEPAVGHVEVHAFTAFLVLALVFALGMLVQSARR